MSLLKSARKYIAKQNRKYTSVMEPMPFGEWPGMPDGFRVPESVWRSAYFLAQVFRETQGFRVSIIRCAISGLGADGQPIYEDGISWDELMKVKNEVGFGGQWAVEIYPPDEEVVNVANMRHLWVIAEPPYGWKRGETNAL